MKSSAVIKSSLDLSLTWMKTFKSLLCDLNPVLIEIIIWSHKLMHLYDNLLYQKQHFFLPVHWKIYGVHTLSYSYTYHQETNFSYKSNILQSNSQTFNLTLPPLLGLKKKQTVCTAFTHSHSVTSSHINHHKTLWITSIISALSASKTVD